MPQLACEVPFSRILTVSTGIGVFSSPMKAVAIGIPPRTVEFQCHACVA
jgi:hypothetical protein